MKNLDILIPVKNEAKNIKPLLERIDKSFKGSKISYNLIFIDDHSEDETVKILKKYQCSNIKVYKKLGKPGKAYSILEGVNYTTSQNIAMLDADLQYPPEVIPEMFQELIKGNCGVVVAKRKNFHTSFIRKSLSLGFKHFFGNFLFNLNVDVQSGLKLFKREIISKIRQSDISEWTLDLPLLYIAKDLGYGISEVEIDFQKRSFGKSNVNLVSQIIEIGTAAIKLKIKNRRIFSLPPGSSNTMLGSGIAYKGKRFITHTTLNSKISSFQTLTGEQKFILLLVACLILTGFFINSFIALSIFIAALSSVYFIDVFFNLYLILKSLHSPPEVHISDKEILELKSKDLPVYSILCPLYKEAEVVPNFIESIKKLDYPKSKLDVQLLLEEDDVETIKAVRRLKLPTFIKITIVPDSLPKTKPKACNYGLNLAKGEYLVIFDVEDRPDSNQLKKAYIAFGRVKPSVACLQAKLNYYNPNQNLLTRFFTAEYSLWFEIMLPALQAIETNIPLGGTSNHFRTKTLLKLKGWDSFNVTEDCDLGVRLFIEGKTTEIINSHTLEEANSDLGNWIRQRSRWIKGYMQTFLVHSRNPIDLYKKEGIHALIFQLTIGAKISFLFINPILWIATFAYFAFNSIVGPTIESLYSPPVFYLAVISAVFGNFLYLYYYMIGCAKKGHFSLIKFIFFVPIYWLFGSVAAFIALYQLIFKPHYWEKTIHGLDLKDGRQKKLKKLILPVMQKAKEFALPPFVFPSFGTRALFNQLTNSRNYLLKNVHLLTKEKLFLGGSVLVFAAMVTNITNFLFSTLLARGVGKNLTLEQFGEISFFTSLLFIFSIPTNALFSTITQKCAFLFGKYSKARSKKYIKVLFSRTFLTSSVITLIWVLLVPFMRGFFKTEDYSLFVIFAPIWIINVMSANYSGYIKGTFGFGKLALITIAESFSKLLIAYILVSVGQSNIVFWAFPISLFIGLILSIIFVWRDPSDEAPIKESKFNKTFYISSLMSGFTNIAFLGLDVVLVKHFLTPTEAGKYGLLSLVGKMIFFFGSLPLPFILPLISQKRGANQKTGRIFSLIFGLSAIFIIIPTVVLSVFGPVLLPIFFGERIISILPFLTLYSIAIALFTIAQPIVYYFQAKENHYFVLVSFFVSLLQIGLLSVFHSNLSSVVQVMFTISFLNLIALAILYMQKDKLWLVTNALRDFKDLLNIPIGSEKYKEAELSEGLRILIFNWRDIKHKWAGGAETYLHQMAKNWVESGHKVTIFCGNDGDSPKSEYLDGVHIVRRGGFYMVYIWAFLYYVVRFRGLYDVVIDSENGIPFFTPLYIRKPKFLLIHHIHQDVFRKHLIRPLATFATFLETKLMPWVYKNERVITVSESSKKEILKLGNNLFQSIDIVYPGVDLKSFKRVKKSKSPSLLYLGRLKPYKNIDVLIKALPKVLEKYPKATLTIAGHGESLSSLKRLANSLGVEQQVSFLGKVTEQEKTKLLSTHWLFLQASMIEGWGITVIEANASGTPVIASDVSGLRDSVVNGKTGILVKDGSVEGFVKNIKLLIKDQNMREKFSKQAYTWSKNFQWNKNAQGFIAHLEKTSNKQSNVAFGKVTLIPQEVENI